MRGLVTGSTGWRSIAVHHCPATMRREDWLGSSTASPAPVSTFADATARAERIVGRNPRILCTPGCFSGCLAVRLHLEKEPS